MAGQTGQWDSGTVGGRYTGRHEAACVCVCVSVQMRLCASLQGISRLNRLFLGWGLREMGGGVCESVYWTVVTASWMDAAT